MYRVLDMQVECGDCADAVVPGRGAKDHVNVLVGVQMV